MSRGPGRPPKPPEEHRVKRSIRLSDAEWREVEQAAEAEGVPTAVYVRRKALEAARG